MVVTYTLPLAGNRTVETAIEQLVVPHHDPSAIAKRLKKTGGEDKLLLVVKKEKVILAEGIQVYRISIQLSDRYALTCFIRCHWLVALNSPPPIIACPRSPVVTRAEATLPLRAVTRKAIGHYSR